MATASIEPGDGEGKVLVHELVQSATFDTEEENVNIDVRRVSSPNHPNDGDVIQHSALKQKTIEAIEADPSMPVKMLFDRLFREVMQEDQDVPEFSDRKRDKALMPTNKNKLAMELMERVVTETKLMDELYWKLMSDFIGPQTGEGFELEATPCKNRVLIQIGFLKEANNSPWIAVVEWLRKIFPQNQSADFRLLIETAIETILSLRSEDKPSFLESHVNFNYVGSICDSIGVQRDHLLEMKDFSDQARSVEVTNALVLELVHFVTKENMDPVVLVTWLRNFDPEFYLDGDVEKAHKDFIMRVEELKSQHQSYCGRRDGKKDPTIENLLHRPFEQMEHKVSVEREKTKCTIKEENSSEGRDQELDASCNGDEAQDDKAEQLTLLDIAMQSIQKLSSVYGGKAETCRQVSMGLLRNQYNQTCKENPAMMQFEETIQSCEGVPLASPVTFLHHNAQFLIDIQDAVERQMMSFEKELIDSSGEKLGRDKNPKFAKFVNFSESATSRYIHMVCDVLSLDNPDKFDYRGYWVAFCEEKGNPSRIAVNSSNRFNSYYEAAAGLTHHHKEITLFFSDLLALDTGKCPNIILESVAEDASDPVLQSLVCVLAIVYCKVLSPYWQLLRSAAEYLHFSQHLLSLYQKFIDWSKEPSTLLEPEETTNMFLQFPSQEKTFDRVFEYCGMWHTNRDLIKAFLRRMVKVIAAVTEDNLKDFLPGGTYSQSPSPDARLKLSRCTLAVLMGGYPLKHAHPDVERRPDTPSQQASFNYLPSVSSDEADAMSESSDSTGSTNSQSDRANTEVVSVVKRKRDSDQKSPIEERMDRDYIVATVERNGGPCKTQQDVDKMLLRFEGKPRSEKWEAVRCELLYQTIVLSNHQAGMDAVGRTTSEMVSELKLALPRIKPSFSFVAAPERTIEKKKPARGRSKKVFL
ncbi:uncharacterized protein LOC142989650 [Genypterus blacodes]|uniref:uncharacterized protein LOC142989650 n=1 Tax=Genypterus blacodes TaxID=154954 RepID=UPI003F775A1F